MNDFLNNSCTDIFLADIRYVYSNFLPRASLVVAGSYVNRLSNVPFCTEALTLHPVAGVGENFSSQARLWPNKAFEGCF